MSEQLEQAERGILGWIDRDITGPMADFRDPNQEWRQLVSEFYGTLFVTGSGHQLHATAFKRTLAWTTIAEGRRTNDLRHTAACLWLARGVDPETVQAWMGHASIATTNFTCTTWEPLLTGLVWTV